MFWIKTERQENDVFLVVGVSLVDGNYQEFVGRDRSIASAKSKAVALSWRAAMSFRGLPAECEAAGVDTAIMAAKAR